MNRRPRPRRAGVDYDQNYYIAPLRKTVLSITRKRLILTFRKHWKLRPLGSKEWIRELHIYIERNDNKVQMVDIVRWMATHKWIIDPNGVPPSKRIQPGGRPMPIPTTSLSQAANAAASDSNRRKPVGTVRPMFH